MATKGKNHAWLLEQVKQLKIDIEESVPEKVQKNINSIETVLTEKVQENKEKAIKSQRNK